MKPTHVKPPRMTQMSWTEVREALDTHQKALGQLFANSDALKFAIHGEIVDGKLVCPVAALPELSFWGRLKWLLTGKLA